MNDKIKRIIMIVCLLLGLFLLGYGIQMIDDDKNLNNNNIADTISEKLNGKAYNKYYFDIVDVTNYFDVYLADKYPINNIDDVSYKDKTKFLLDILCDVDTNSVDFEKLNEENKKYFYNNKLVKESIKGNEGEVLYTFEKSKYFLKRKMGYNYLIVSRLLSAEGFTDRWTVKKKLYYLDVNIVGDMYQLKVYKTIADFKEGKVLKVFNKNDYVLNESDYKSIEDSLEVFVYKFRKINKSYYLESVKIS